MMSTSTRVTVTESYGHGTRTGIRITETTAPRELAASTVRGLIAELRHYACGYADTVSDVTSNGDRLITATHWINGFENVRQLRIVGGAK